GDGFHFFQNRFFRAAGNEFSLMRRDRTKAATAETSAVHVDRKTDHFVSRYRASFSVFWMGHTGIGQIEGSVDLRFSHRWIRRIDDELMVADSLREPSGLHFIGFLLHVFEIGSV